MPSRSLRVDALGLRQAAMSGSSVRGESQLPKQWFSSGKQHLLTMFGTFWDPPLYESLRPPRKILWSYAVAGPWRPALELLQSLPEETCWTMWVCFCFLNVGEQHGLGASTSLGMTWVASFFDVFCRLIIYMLGHAGASVVVNTC